MSTENPIPPSDPWRRRDDGQEIARRGENGRQFFYYRPGEVLVDPAKLARWLETSTTELPPRGEPRAAVGAGARAVQRRRKQ